MKHLDYDNMRYLETGARSERLFVESLMVCLFVSLLCIAKIVRVGLTPKQLSFCDLHFEDPLTEGLLISTKYTWCSKSVSGLIEAGHIGGFRAIWI